MGRAVLQADMWLGVFATGLYVKAEGRYDVTGMRLDGAIGSQFLLAVKLGRG